MGKDDQRKEALLKARRKFLKVTAGAAGAAVLASCGGQFVRPTNPPPSPLKVKLQDIDNKIMNLMAALYNSPELRKEYALRPLHVFKKFGLADGINLPKAERLLSYIYNNDHLSMQMLKLLEESGYLENIKYKAKDLKSYHDSVNGVVVKLVAEETVLREQLSILLTDPGVQSILGVQVTSNDLGELITEATHQIKEMSTRPEPTSCSLAIVCAGVAVLALVKAVVVGQVVVAANFVVDVNVYHTHNYNTNTNGVGNEQVESNLRQMLAIHEWDILARAISESARRAG